MLRVLVVLLPLTLIACSPDRPATMAFLKVDPSADPRQTQDRPGTQWNPLKAAAPKAGTSSSAWLEPSPASFSFSADDSAWKTFTVRTSSDVDSVLVVVNPTGKDRALEVAGGSRPPSRNYCPAEGNDSPTRTRRNGWSLHLSACAVGETEIVLFDHEQTELARYAIQVAEAKAEAEAEAGTGSSAWLEPSPDSFSFTADDSAWKTFTVRTSSDVDSVLVVVNPTGKDRALEVAGGNRPPSRDYCPAEGNDSPTRARRNGWPLYLSVCEAGETEIVLFDYEQTELARYDVRVQEPSEESPRFNIEPDTTLPAPTEPFNIDLYWEINYPAPFIEAVERAAYKWESIITQGLEDGNREHLPSDVPDIDDLAIVVRLNDKPGANQEGSVYGAATIDLRRTAEHYTNDVGIPIYGSIYLPDKPEYREGYKNNEYVKYYSDQLNFLAIHEIGHVLGLAYSFLAQDGNGFSRAYSPKALEVWKQHVPQQYHQGRNYVPIHSGHWSYQYPASDYAKMWIITNSTMTIFRLSQFDVFGHYRAYDNPGGDTYYTDKIITELDVAALDDMGYTVDMDQAEPLMVKMKSAASYGFGKANTYSQIICEGIH